MYTIRLDIQGTAPLDGTTPFNLVASTQRIQDGLSNDPAFFGERATQVLIFTLPASEAFGVFDPGEAVNRKNKNARLVSLSVTPEVATVFAIGDIVQLVGPAGNRSPFVDLARNNGLYNNIDRVIPVDHKLAFDTTAGAVVGPYRIDMTFVDIEEPSEFFGKGT